MRDIQNIFSFFLVFILFRSSYSIHVNTLSSTDSITISSNRTIVSPGEVFELGFFNPSLMSSRWYLGIWYKKISERTYVWVANRDNPLSGSIGTFKISDTNLVLLDHSNNTVWSTNLTKRDLSSPVVAELLDNGNFVMRYSVSNTNNESSEFLWQSFDYPTDTLLPEMKLGLDLKTGFNRFLRSWRSPDDPASGDYSYKLDIQEVPEFFLSSKDVPLYRTGPWNGIRFSSVPNKRNFNDMVDNFTQNREEVTYTFLMANDDVYSRLKVSPSGYIQQSTWIPAIGNWTMTWAFPSDQCDDYKRCGPYSHCDTNTYLKCNCIEGFEDGSQGCVRKTELSFGGGDAFLRLENTKLPDTTTATVLNRSNGVDECLKKCNDNYNCTAFANADIRGSGCVIWTGELMDIRILEEGGQDLYVRLAAADLNLGLLKKNKLWLIITGLELVMCLLKTHTNVWFI